MFAASQLVIRPATADDLPAIVHLLADDPLGATRERDVDPLPQPYRDAFAAIDADPMNELVVACTPDGAILGTLQLTITASLSRLGTTRATIEGVRVAATARSLGLGQRLVEWAIARATARGCGVIQLTTDRTRVDAHRFYERLGFVASHVGMKRSLDPHGTTA